MIEFVYDGESIILRLVKHIGESSIGELVPFFICYEIFQTDEKISSRLKTKLKVLDQIIDALLRSGAKYGEEVKIFLLEWDINLQENINAGNILNDIVQKHNIIVDGKDLINYIASSAMLQKYFDAIKNAETTKIASICNVLTGLIRYYAPDMAQLGPLDPFGPGAMGQNKDKDKALEVIATNMSVLETILRGKPENGEEKNVQTTFGSTIKVLGSERLRAIEIIQKVIRLEDHDINEKISELNILKLITVNIFIPVLEKDLGIVYHKKTV